MTLDEWLDDREPAPPPALAARLSGMTRLVPAGTPRETTDALLGVADALLAELLPNGCRSREDAMDLLVADALVTYAFEAAADGPELLEQQSTSAMWRLAAFAGSR